ncbi:MAG: trypsin-like peptidase domain-containing protein [Methylicorpusculum sp.]|uniref:trypsin-like peptidase domain-containing protein n=1 Tax=Methylicorpusculum sp. TaxID=2713644 RepID=UPI0027252869|nr:trypsin-like peptidase domain-containing protein [Methylicorpusculum sp.]MDO8938461.1 trypsin-like peptidase domain-containing protein [Methylicorpusculum sp.]MDP2201007.1 trypsin-like peptidase domain-containing protein [Methylicorpusculum sp.]
MSPSPDQRLIEAIDSSIKLLVKFSIPLYLDDNDRPTPFGTGFFVQQQDDIFLVTAAHVLDKAQSHKLYYYTSPGDIRHISGKMVRRTHDGDRRNDHIDIGVVKMSGGMLPPYPDINKYPMDISYLKPKHLPRSGKHYSFTGFPATKTKVRNCNKSIEVVAYSYRSDSIPESEYTKYKVDASTHIVLPLDTKKGYDKNRNLTHFPKPQGMSGSPVVALYEEGEADSIVFPVVGVAIEHRARDNIVIATDVKYVLEAIHNAI